MKFLLFAFLILLSKQSVAQSSIENKIRALTGFYIGDTLDKVKDSIICADASYLNSPFSEDSKCRSFRYLLIQKDSAIIADVPFGSLIFAVDSNKKIKTLTLLRSYVSTNSVSRVQETNDHFMLLSNFFNDLFQLAGEQLTHEEYSYLQNGFKWKRDSIAAVLNQTNFRKKKNGKKLATLTIDIYVE